MRKDGGGLRISRSVLWQTHAYKKASLHANQVLPSLCFQCIQSCRDEERRWRAEDLQQRALDNARVLWARFVEKNRRDVEERAEQLKGFSNLAALVAGFVMISYLQVRSKFNMAPFSVHMPVCMTQ